MQVETMRYPKTSGRMLVENDLFLPFFQEERCTSYEIDLDNAKSFSQDLFNSEASVMIRDIAKHSTFIQGMAEGTLDPEIYAGHLVQDAAYCFNAVKTLDRAAESCQSNGAPEFASLFRSYSKKFKTYNQDFVKKWKLNSQSVEMGPAAAISVGFETCLSREDPKFLPIAMLPSQMLWSWIAGELIGSVNEDNPYYHCFHDNKPDPSGKKSTVEMFVDSFFKTLDEAEKEKALMIFLESMVNEVNFFRDACGEMLELVH